MKFAIEISMTAQVRVKRITNASVIKNLVQPAKPKDVVMDEILDDRHFEIGARNQRLLERLLSNRSLLVRYVKLRSLFEAISQLEREAGKNDLDREMEKIEKSLIGKLAQEDAKWFRGAINYGAWSESTEHFNRAFAFKISDLRMRAKPAGRAFASKHKKRKR